MRALTHGTISPGCFAIIYERNELWKISRKVAPLTHGDRISRKSGGLDSGASDPPEKWRPWLTGTLQTYSLSQQIPRTERIKQRCKQRIEQRFKQRIKQRSKQRIKQRFKRWILRWFVWFLVGWLVWLVGLVWFVCLCYSMFVPVSSASWKPNG